MANNGYFGSIPNIAQAFQNDPRSKLAQSALALGTSTAPVAAGGWAVPDGLARAAQAILGAVVNNKQEKKYGAREADYLAQMQKAAELAQQPQNPAVANPATQNPMTAAASALGGMPQQPPVPGPSPSQSNGPLQQIDPNTAFAAPPAAQPPMGAAQPPAMAPMAPPPPPMPPAPQMGAGGASSPVSAGGLDPLDLYRRGIRPIEGGTDPKTGAFRTSPKGAVGPGQVMPATGPEAARLAGLPWDEKRFRSDTQYNDALGAAYFAKQLNDFKDPVIAAAAYNAGPGGVRRALRKARNSGTDWRGHLPAETQGYVQKFTQAVSGDAATPAIAPPNDGGRAVVPQAQMEAVPNAPEAPAAQAPGAPQLPAEVATQRLAIAQSLLASGNPDLASMATQYLNEGLSEQNASRMLAAKQQFEQGQTGYTANLNDWSSARSDSRQNQYGERREAQNRNFQRGERQAGQEFQASEGQVQRGWQSGERRADQSFTADQAQRGRVFSAQDREDQQAFTAEQNALNRNNKVDVAGIRQQQRSAYFNSPTGLKMQQANQEKINANQEAIAKYQRFMDLNGEQNTGGVGQNLPVIGGALNWGDRQLSEMDKIAKDTTLANLGGGLGAQISDSDRKFIEGANIGTSNTRTVNENVARARIGVLRRSNDYYTEFANAQADNNAAQFSREWSMFADSVPIVQYGKDKRPVVADKPMTFSEWKASRPRFDATGKRIN